MKDNSSGILTDLAAAAGAAVGGTLVTASTTNSVGSGDALGTLTEDPGLFTGITTIVAGSSVLGIPIATGAASTENSQGDVIRVRIVDDRMSGNSERMNVQRIEENATKIYDKYHKNHERKPDIEPILKVTDPSTAEELEKLLNSFSSREELEIWLVSAIRAREKILQEIEEQNQPKKRIKK